MMETKIIRNDRGLDFRRIDQFIKMFQEECLDKSRKIDKKKSEIEKERKVQAFEHFGLIAEIEAIKSINAQIEELEKQQKSHEEKIRDYTQGIDKNKRYNTYDQVREGSPIHQFINEGSEQIRAKHDEVWTLNKKLANELWYARDLEQAIEIIRKFEELLDGISMEV